jgi:uncharacterized membrane protein
VHGRTFRDAVGSRTVGTIDAFIISLFVTGNISLVGGIALIEVPTKVLIHCLDERIWAAVPRGQQR